MIKSILSDKFIKKWMRLARHIALDNDTPCSRKVGSVVVNKDNIVLGIGYNGNPRSIPHCDSAEYIRYFLWPRLNAEEKDRLVSPLRKEAGKYSHYVFQDDCDIAASLLDGCKTCPRRLLGYKPGERIDLCDCQHSERNVISNCIGGVAGGILFNWSCISCRSCTGALINARIAEVHFLDGPEYESGCLRQYNYANIPVFLHSEESING